MRVERGERVRKLYDFESVPNPRSRIESNLERLPMLYLSIRQIFFVVSSNADL